ncbi:MAG: DNA-protecting protein DprA [Burkholderiales bacterium]|nr:DNA-protecting protein DprA [Burkholderiales bacterium]
MERDELAAWLRLALTDRIGNVAGRKLLAAFGLPQQVLAQPRAALEQLLTPAQCSALEGQLPNFEAQLEATWQWLTDTGGAERWIVTLADADYPASLLQTEDPPLLLYAMGPRAAGFPHAALAVVGSRNPTPQGKSNARAFGRALAQAGLTVVSGLALGVDGAAHEGALEGAPSGQLATIAVVGTGLDRVYPKQHHDLAHRIAGRGFVISEYPLGTPPLEANFPKRNRLISALGLGTLVVEAAVQSGSLITARLAAEQGKDVFAVPGSIHSPQSRGCHLLIRQGAKLVETAQDVLEDLKLAAPAAAARAHDPQPPETSLLTALGYDPVGLDALIARTGIPAALLQAQLLELELAGEVARLPGGLFQRVGAA